ncbi:MAG: hypothetical protein HAW66_01385 [Shewanella sp.]|nr:hypothetical protein [Shewanella sp.]
MKLQKLDKNFIFILLSFVFGLASCEIFSRHQIKEMNKLVQLSYKSSLDSYALNVLIDLSIAKAIRENELDEALKIIETKTDMNIENFTNKGRNTNKLSKVQQNAFNAAKIYHKTYCTEECFIESSYIFLR